MYDVYTFSNSKCLSLDIAMDVFTYQQKFTLELFPLGTFSKFSSSDGQFSQENSPHDLLIKQWEVLNLFLPLSSEREKRFERVKQTIGSCLFF